MHAKHLVLLFAALLALAGVTNANFLRFWKQEPVVASAAVVNPSELPDAESQAEADEFVDSESLSSEQNLSLVLQRYPPEIAEAFDQLPSKIQNAILQRAPSVPGCWASTTTLVPYPPNSCPAGYPDLGLNSRCYQSCPPGSFGLGGYCWRGMTCQRRSYTPAVCPKDSPLREFGLCIDKCPMTAAQYGPICVSKLCPTHFGFRCGFACTESTLDCGKLLLGYANMGVKSLVHLVQFQWADLSQDVQDIIASVMAWPLCS